MDRHSFALGALFAGIAVALGAFGAHGLKGMVEESALQTWEVAVRYQLWHALALLITAFAAEKLSADACRLARRLFVIGILLFSGSLYGLTLGGPSWLGPVTPLGGLALIGGWVVLIKEACSCRKESLNE